MRPTLRAFIEIFYEGSSMDKMKQIIHAMFLLYFWKVPTRLFVIKYIT